MQGVQGVRCFAVCAKAELYHLKFRSDGRFCAEILILYMNFFTKNVKFYLDRGIRVVYNADITINVIYFMFYVHKKRGYSNEHTNTF